MQRDKGKRGELEAAKFIRDHWGVEARRGKQFQGGEESPDVKHSIEGVVIEVKRRETLSIYPSIEQALEDCDFEEKPAVLHRRNREEWLLVIRAKDFPKICADYIAAVGCTQAIEFDGKVF
jgi:Holliday junction resolvase